MRMQITRSRGYVGLTVSFVVEVGELDAKSLIISCRESYMFGWTLMVLPSYICEEINAFTRSSRLPKYIINMPPARTTWMGLKEDMWAETCSTFMHAGYPIAWRQNTFGYKNSSLVKAVDEYDPGN